MVRQYSISFVPRDVEKNVSVVLTQSNAEEIATVDGITPRVNGKRISKNVYAKTREECEEKLAELIKKMKAEIAAEKKKAKQA